MIQQQEVCDRMLWELTCFVPPLQGSGGFVLGKVTHRLRGGLSSVARLRRSGCAVVEMATGDAK